MMIFFSCCYVFACFSLSLSIGPFIRWLACGGRYIAIVLRVLIVLRSTLLEVQVQLHNNNSENLINEWIKNEKKIRAKQMCWSMNGTIEREFQMERRRCRRWAGRWRGGGGDVRRWRGALVDFKNLDIWFRQAICAFATNANEFQYIVIDRLDDRPGAYTQSSPRGPLFIQIEQNSTHRSHASVRSNWNDMKIHYGPGVDGKNNSGIYRN